MRKASEKKLARIDCRRQRGDLGIRCTSLINNIMTGYRKDPALDIIVVTFVRKLDENTIDIARADYAGSQPPAYSVHIK